MLWTETSPSASAPVHSSSPFWAVPSFLFPMILSLLTSPCGILPCLSRPSSDMGTGGKKFGKSYVHCWNAKGKAVLDKSVHLSSVLLGSFFVLFCHQRKEGKEVGKQRENWTESCAVTFSLEHICCLFSEMKTNLLRDVAGRSNRSVLHLTWTCWAQKVGLISPEIYTFSWKPLRTL